MRKMTLVQRQHAAWADIIGPLLFVAVFMIKGWLRPGYDPLTMYVSALSLGPRGWIQIVNFIVFGLLFLVFTRGVAAELGVVQCSHSQESDYPVNVALLRCVQDPKRK